VSRTYTALSYHLESIAPGSIAAQIAGAKQSQGLAPIPSAVLRGEVRTVTAQNNPGFQAASVLTIEHHCIWAFFHPRWSCSKF
jgi:hypothetical protein